MNIALIGASGFIGSVLLKEAVSRQHQVTAFVSHPEKISATIQVAVQATDVQNLPQLTEQLQGFDAVITAFSGHANEDVVGYYVSGIKNIIQAAKNTNAMRLLVVGGAGSLEVAPGMQVMDQPGFPDAYRASAEGARQALSLLREETSLNWTMLCPSGMIEPGQRTNQFRLGKDQLLIASDGKSHISVEDYALAMINELEQPAHAYQRFTVGY
ncbi:NAD(P)-dependent oxidoreductase [Undibacterium sp. Dicai25W]|uniref:NAD(P)-dependent oxidoreductase n=1 Tax=Undibacterium sp. Dicai25W TaxID=3413034 RepID=UPI003BF08D3B